MDKISVITVTYNASATLENTILSIINQSYKNIEYIIIDGGSTDSTLEIIKKYQPKLAYCVSEKDSGIYDAMNKGIKASTGDWIIFLGADDIFYNENVLTKIFAENKNYNLDCTDFAYGNVIIKSNGKIFGGSRTYDQLINCNINHQGIFYKKSIFEIIGAFNLKYKILADYELNLRIYRNHLLKKKYIPEIVTIYNNKGISNQFLDENFYEDQLEYFINIEKVSLKDYRLQTYFFFYGFTQLLKNKRSAGFKNIIHALRFGKRKMFYVLFCIKYFLSLFRVVKKIRSASVFKSGLNEHYL
ncbi:MAG: glycosyltransferase family 2 protein [Ginsengibacter sp.]